MKTLLSRRIGLLGPSLLALSVGCVVTGESPATAGSTTSQPLPERACLPVRSTFEAIQTRIFAARGCTAEACHGQRAAGGLRLGPAEAYDALIDVPATASGEKRIAPGSPDASYLYQKLRAATFPGSITVAGSPMPVGAPPLSDHELAAVRAWIAAGAPRDDRDAERTAEILALLGPCAEAATPPSIAASPLPIPDAEEGIQLRMPPQVAEPDSEWEGCIATYIDLTRIVPARFQDAEGRTFRVQSTEIRQSAGSHHLTILPTGLGLERAHHPAFGAWTCRGGDAAGRPCDPAAATSCGEAGVCASTPKAGIACTGYGPPGTFIDPSSFGLGKSGKPHMLVPAIEGVYREVGLRGIIFWNLHAYNLTSEPRTQTGELNLRYADDTRHREQTLTLSAPGFAGIPPFTKRDVCGSWIAPRGATLVRLSSHTHRHGHRFWMTDSDGQLMYESFDYKNPTYLALDPPRVFDAPSAAARTIRFCATFNNGLRADGSFDTELVTRLSRMPAYAPTRCVPTACTAGRVGAACRGAADHGRCDTSPGQGDGRCDACPIVAGETTEHEMFIMHPDFYVPGR